MKIYTIEEIIDLGNHILHVYLSEELRNKRYRERRENYEANQNNRYLPSFTERYEACEYDIEEN